MNIYLSFRWVLSLLMSRVRAAVLGAAVLLVSGLSAQTTEAWKTLLKSDLTFFLASDLGRNGYYEQKPIAELMGEMANVLDPECVVAAGDVFHYEGVGSTSDPLWLTNFEWVYAHPELQIEWYPLLGNHEYRGNTQAVIDYSHISRRWMMPDRYYTKVLREKGVTLRLVLIDTCPLIDKYRKDSDTYPDVARQDMQRQLDWLDRTLAEAKEDWVVVVGHHPMYAGTNKDERERTDLQARVLPILHRYKDKVACYVGGHIHNFQHIRQPNDPIDYVVNSSASLSRKMPPAPGTVFINEGEGFTVFSATKQQLRLHFIDKQGRVIHTIERT